MNRLVASRLVSYEQVAQQVVVPPASGRFAPLADPGHVYVCFEARSTSAWGRLLPRHRTLPAETYNLRLTGEGLVISVLRLGRPLHPATLVPYDHVSQLKFYYGESRIRIRFRRREAQGQQLTLPVQPTQQQLVNPLRSLLNFRRQKPSVMYMNFVLEAERVRLLETLVAARMLDFRRSPAPAGSAGFAVVFLDRLVSVRHAGGVAIHDLVNLLEDEQDDNADAAEDQEWFDANEDVVALPGVLQNA